MVEYKDLKRGLKNQRRVLLNQVFIMKGLYEILLHTAGGHGELIDTIAAEVKATEEHLRSSEVTGEILDAGFDPPQQ